MKGCDISSSKADEVYLILYRLAQMRFVTTYDVSNVLVP